MMMKVPQGTVLIVSKPVWMIFSSGKQQ